MQIIAFGSASRKKKEERPQEKQRSGRKNKEDWPQKSSKRTKEEQESLNRSRKSPEQKSKLIHESKPSAADHKRQQLSETEVFPDACVQGKIGQCQVERQVVGLRTTDSHQ
ncbi:MAG TPA: hypothetical protein VG122_06975 [Gemmata sp.]|nr:hypothetical protein [Gemmata sp.]